MKENYTNKCNYNKSIDSFKFEKLKSLPRNLIIIKDSEKIPTKNLIILLLILIPFALILSYFTIPRERFSPYQLEQGQISTENIKSPFDIEIEDRRTTERKIEETLETIPPIFDYNPVLINNKKQYIDSLLKFINSYVRALIDENEGLNKISNDDYQQLLDELKDMHEIEFNIAEIKELANIVDNEKMDILKEFIKGDLIEFIYDRKLIRDRIELNRYQRTGIIIRNIADRQEEHILMWPDILDLDNVFDAIRTKVDIFLININSPLRDSLNTIIERILEPNITFNSSETQKYKNEVINNIPKVFFSKKRGERIISEGERVTGNHILILDEINRRIADKQVTYSHYFYIFIYCIIIVILFFFLLLLFHQWHALSNYYNYLMILSLFILNIFIINVFWHFYQLLSTAFNKEPFIVNEYYIYALPFAFGVLTLAALLNAKTAFTFGMFQLCFYIFIFNLDTYHILYAFIGICVASMAKNIVPKKDFYIKSILLIILLQSASALLNSLIKEYYDTEDIIFRLVLVIISGLSVYVLVNTFIPLFEYLFKLSTDMKLMELLDFKHPLLEKLMFSASGTLHHSIAVANLSEIAARSIGCNPVLCRVASYYHDIGKVNKPDYFIENISGSENKHDKLKPSMSALIIISHVKMGYELGKKYRLPAPILDIIKQHHGRSLIKYFYSKALENPDKARDGSISEDNFRYPGPKPWSKEAAIILLADRVEATSRVMVNPSTSNIRSMVENIVKGSLLDGDLDNANISLNEISVIIDSFCKVLYGAFHRRIDYPDQPVNYKR